MWAFSSRLLRVLFGRSFAISCNQLVRKWIPPPRVSVKSGSQTRLLAVLLAVFTLAAFGLAIANLVQESSIDPATDGARWTETTLADGSSGLRAYIVPSDTPAERAGIRKGDVLTAINGASIHRIAGAPCERRTPQSGTRYRCHP
jgi:hypothetical protein